MAKVCPSCGAEAPLQFRFCGFCGAPLDFAPPEPAADTSAAASDSAGQTAGRSARRLVTMLFADLSNYTHAASHVDPEEIFIAIRRTLERLAQSVHRLGGRLDRYIGDGFLATFGIPEAHEDDHTRALLAALEMQQAMHALHREAQQSLGWDVQLRIGINLGPVISGYLDTGDTSDASVFGHAVNVAQRLQQAARPGTILVSEAIYRLTRAQFEFKEPVNLRVKGLDAPLVSYEIIGPRSVPQPTRGLAGRSSPLIGRAAETAALLAGLQRLKVDRRGLIALISGEPGIGKSRLVDEVLAPLSDHFTIVRAGTSPNETASYGLLTRLVENLTGIQPDDSSAVRRQRLEDRLAPSSTLSREIGPVLFNLVSGQASREMLIGNPQQDQRRIYAAIRRLLAWLARRRAMLLVLDDLQWADRSSLAALTHAADLVNEAPLAILALSRPNALAQLPPPWTPGPTSDPSSATDHLNLHLGPLSPAESDELVANLLNDLVAPPEVARQLITRIGERTSGNPLLIEEMVRMLLDQGVLRPGTQGREVAPQWMDAVEQVPETVNGLILSRYDRLLAPLKKTLDAAAVLGNSFSLPLLLGITNLPEAELRGQLDSLEQADFLRRAPGNGLPVYIFRHWLMQEAIYQTILQKERRALHLRAAQVIQQMAEHLAVDAAARVGYHLERGQSREAIGYLMQAARRAADRYANEEAIDYYRRIEAQLEQHGARQEEAVDVALGLSELLTRTGQATEAREALERAHSLSLGPPHPGYRLADVLYQMGQVRSRQGLHAEARAAFEAAAQQLGDSGAPASGDQGLTVSRARIENAIGFMLLRQGQLAEARSRGDNALRLALQQNDLEAAATAHNLLAGSHYGAGQMAESVASALHALALREQLGDVWSSAASQNNLGSLYYKLGQWAQAEAYLRQAIFVQQEIGDYQGVGATWNNLGLLLLDSGRFEEALHSLGQSLGALRGQQHLPSLAMRHLSRGQVWLRLGVATWAIADLERSLDAAVQTKNDDVRAHALASLADAQMLDGYGGDLEQAREFLGQAEVLADASGSLETRAEVMRVRARLRRAEHDWERALEANHQAQELFSQIGNRYEVARRQIEAAEIQLARPSTSRPADSGVAAAVREALETFRQLHAQADIPNAENVLARLNAGLAEGAPVEQAVVVVHIRLQLPDLAGESDDRQEELAGLFSRLTGALEKVGRERGALVTTTGTGQAFLFSGPAIEISDSLAQQAVQAAHDAIDSGARLNRASRRQYGFEIALSAGLTAGRWTNAGADSRQAAVFASASLPGRYAAAAAGVAAANQIAVTGDITQPVRSLYELVPLEATPETRLPGPIFAVGQVRSDTRLPQALPASSPALVGRAAELAALDGWVDRLRHDRRGLVCYIEAEAGMGKTRLLEQVLEYARPSVQCLIGKCESFRSGISYWMLVDILERADLPDVPAIQQLQSLLGLRPADEADDQLLRNLPPAGLRQEIFARVRALLLQAAAQRPVLLVIEDIHWLDLSSLDLIDYLLPLTLEAPIALMLVARAEMPGPHRALVSKAEHVAQERYLPVSFSSLTELETRELVSALLRSAELPEALWPLLAPFSGHPLSVEEALRFLVESGWLWEADGAWHLAQAVDAGSPAEAEPASPSELEGLPGDGASLPSGLGWPLGRSVERRMPATFKDLLLRRLDLLPSETLHVVQAAAVLGENFDHTVLSHVIAGPAVARRLTELVERGWVLPANPDNPLLFRFKHTLTRETIYATLLTSKLRVLHQRAGEALESLYPETQAENVELLAHHFTHSSLREKALGYLVRAGQTAAARHALAEGLTYYQQAREIVAQYPLLQPRLAAAIALGLADVHLGLGDPASAVGDLLPQLDAPGGDVAPEVYAGAWRRLAAARRRLGEFNVALDNLQSARQALASPAVAGPTIPPLEGGQPPAPITPMAEAAEREAWTIELSIAQVLFDMRGTQGQRARAQAEQVLRALDRRRYPELAAETLNLLGGMAYRQGEVDISAQLVRESLAIYQAYGNRAGAAAAYANLGVLAASRQDTEGAFDHFSLSLGLREALGDSLGIAISRNNLGQLERNRGHFDEAILQLSRAAEKARYAEAAPLLAQCLANLGQAQNLAGQHAAALATFDEAEAVCQNSGLKNVLCEVAWKRADCLVEINDLPGAERNARLALALATELNSGDLRSEALRALSRAERLSGRAPQSLEHASTAWQGRAGDPNPVTRARFAAEHALSLLASGQAAEAAELFDEHVNPVELPESAFTLQEVATALAGLSPVQKP